MRQTETGLEEVLKPGETQPPAQEGAERRQIQQASAKSEFSVPTAEAASAEVQLPGYVPPVRCSAGRQGLLFYSKSS